MDLRKAFWQILLDPSSREKIAFSIPDWGLFQFIVVLFGLCNSAQTQQRLCDSLFEPKYQPNVFCYSDDVIIISSNFSEHVRLFSEIIDIPSKANLTVNLNKCKFFQSSLIYLGFDIDRQGIKTNPNKVAAMVNYAVRKHLQKLNASWVCVLGITDSFITLQDLVSH